MNNQSRRILDTRYDNFSSGFQEDSTRKLFCYVKSERYTFENGVLGWYPKNGGKY